MDDAAGRGGEGEEWEEGEMCRFLTTDAREGGLGAREGSGRCCFPLSSVRQGKGRAWSSSVQFS